MRSSLLIKALCRSIGIPTSTSHSSSDGPMWSARRVVPTRSSLQKQYLMRFVHRHPSRLLALMIIVKFCPSSWTPERRPKNMVYAPHWYDLIGLFRKEFGQLSINVQSVTRVSTTRTCFPLSSIDCATRASTFGMLSIGAIAGRERISLNRSRTS